MYTATVYVQSNFSVAMTLCIFHQIFIILLGLYKELLASEITCFLTFTDRECLIVVFNARMSTYKSLNAFKIYIL
jgi:hypothetical protein